MSIMWYLADDTIFNDRLVHLEAIQLISARESLGYFILPGYTEYRKRIDAINQELKNRKGIKESERTYS